MRLCSFAEVSKYFYYPYSQDCKCDFRFDEACNYLICDKCNRKISIKDGIIEFIEDSILDNEKRSELSGNTFDLTPENIGMYTNKDNYQFYTYFYTYFRNKKLDILMHNLAKLDTENVIFLGSGAGYEIIELNKRGLKMRRIFASDLSFSRIGIIPYLFTKYDLDYEFILFTSDLDYCPIKEKTYPIIIFEALHHTPDIHLTIEKLLSFGYNYIVFVEPTNNFIIRFLAKMGLAQRVEHSGVKPDKLEIKKLGILSRKYNYSMTVNTSWEFPEDYFPKILSRFKKLFLKFIGLISYIGKLVNFGNVSVCELKKII